MPVPHPDPIDRELLIAWSGRPHCEPIAHLERTHSLPATAGYLLATVARDAKDPDTERLLAALTAHRDDRRDSATFGCLKWYVEDAAICDTNASFFVCTPLAGLWLRYRDRLNEAELAALRGVFAAVRPWFQHMADAPSLFYPNKCLSDAAMLLATGVVLADEAVTDAGRAFCDRYFDYYRRRGTGWGEDHSPVYTRVLIEMTLLIMALEQHGPLFDRARAMTDAMVDWAAFHDGCDAVPSIRGYNFDARVEIGWWTAALAQTPADQPDNLLVLLKDAAGYTRQTQPAPAPRQRRWRTFDRHYSTSYVTAQARLGTLSEYPLMPNAYMHDDWGLGWQTKPASFIVGRDDYGVLEWQTEDDAGVVRQHEANGSFHDFASRHLVKRLSFHPEVLFVGHQERGAAIILRELRQVHSPTRRIVDRWRLAHDRAEVLVAGQPWRGESRVLGDDWVVLDYHTSAVAIRALQCRGLDLTTDDPNPQRRTAGQVGAPQLRLDRTDRGLLLEAPLVEDHEGVLTAPLLFSGWCVVLLDRAEQVGDLRVTESLWDDGEVPRTYGELIRTVTLTTPEVDLRLERDLATRQVRRWLYGAEFGFVAPRDSGL